MLLNTRKIFVTFLVNNRLTFVCYFDILKHEKRKRNATFRFF